MMATRSSPSLVGPSHRSSSGSTSTESFQNLSSDNNENNEIEMDNLEDIAVTPAPDYKEHHQADAPEDDDSSSSDHEDERALLSGEGGRVHLPRHEWEGSEKTSTLAQVKHLVVEVRGA